MDACVIPYSLFPIPYSLSPIPLSPIPYPLCEIYTEAIADEMHSIGKIN